MRKIYFLLFVLLCGLNASQAEPIDTTIAKQLASRFYQQKANTVVNQRETPKIAQCAKAQINIAGTRQTVNRDCYYVVNFDNGFVIIAADDRVEPILGYSTSGAYNPEVVPVNMAEWMEGYRQEIAAELATDRSANAEVSEQWYKLKHNITETSRSAVAPLLQTTWSQSPYYNQYCPSDPESASGHAVTGCVATAMAQVIRYWEYPSVGLGSHSYTANNHIYSSSYGDYGTLSANFGATSYNYSLMPNSLNNSSTAGQIDAVATLMYHCGVSVDMMYGPSASGASASDIPYALEHYFAYPAGIHYLSRSSYSDNAWSELIKSELNNMQPVVYNGHGTGGHAFVCDGYDGDLFHFNWGWGGYADGYFSLSNLNPASNNFNNGQGIVTGITAASPYIRCGSNTLSIYSPVGGVSEVKEVEVRGHMLNNNISITVNGNFSIGNTAVSLGPSTTLPQDGGTLYVQYQPAASVPQTEQGYITLSSGSIHDTIFLYGTARSTLCYAPTNLTATVNASNVTLNWTAPIQNSIAESTTISWDSSMQYNFSMGTDITYCMLQRYEVSDLTSFNMHYLNAISFIPREGITHCRIVAYQGGTYDGSSFNPGEQIANQEVSISELTFNSWNTIRLLNPFIIDKNRELWIGVIAYVDSDDDYYIVNLGSAPYIAHKGGIVGVYSGNYNESASFYFSEMSELCGGGCTYNISLKAHIEKLVSQVDHYEIYKDEIHLGDVTSTNYVDNNILSNPCRYTVYAVNNNYCTSEASITAYPTIPCLPSVIIGEMVQVNSTTVNCNGIVTHNGNSTLSARGFCWSTSHNPTISDSHISSGNGLGDFSADLTGLTPGTTYYVRAYATNDIGTNYSDEQSITLYFIVPKSGTESYTVSSNSVLVYDNGGPDNNYSDNNGGNLILYAGGADYTFEITGTYDIENPYNENYYDELYIYDGASSSTVLAHLAGNSTISTPITSTQNAIRIYFKSDYSVNHSGFRLIVNRIGSASAPAVTTAEITNIQATTVTGGGNVTADNGAAVTARGVCWSTTPNPTVGGIGCNHTSDGSGTGAFTSSITGLTPNTTYYVRAYATNSVGTSYGEPKTFKTSCNSVIATITGNNTICHGDSTTLSANSSTSYLWSNHSVEKSITVSPSTSTTYSVTITNEYGCTASTSFPVTVHYGTHNVTSVTECEAYTWTSGTGLTYTESGTYIYYYNNGFGCSSADTLHLTIHNGTHNVTSVTECEKYTWTAGTGLTYTESGTYIHYYNNGFGCSSADTLHLTIHNGTHNVTTVTECETYTWTAGTGLTYTESGTHIHYYNNGYGCPSADTLHLTIHNGTHNVINVTECKSYTWTAGTGLTYTESGTYIHYYNNGYGCPSADTLHLTINYGTHNVTSVTECEAYTWTSGTGLTYTESGIYIHYYNNGNGCPSADTLHLTINYGTHNVTSVTECESYTWTAGTGLTYTESGTYIHYYNNGFGCSSADTLHLTINYGTHNVTSVTECEAYTWTSGTGLTYTESGIYIHYYNNGNGCPSADTLHLTINYGTHNVTSVTECESYTWTAGTGLTYTESGTYIHYYNNGYGCPSADTLHLTINYGTHNVTSVTECEAYTWTSGTWLTYTESGTYIYYYNNGFGCSSADTLHLTIHNGTHNVTSVTECEKYTWTAGTGLTYTESGTYIHYYNNGFGCSSADTLHLTIHNGTHNVTTVTECEKYTWTTGTGLTYTESGTYIHYYNNGFDCSSTDTLHLTIHNGTHNVTSVTECGKYTWTAGTGLTYTESGTYIYYYNNGFGCSSADTLHLTIHNDTHNVTTVTECESYTWTAGTGLTYTQSGIYVHQYNNGEGCASADTLHLTIHNGTHNATTITECESYTWTAGTGLTYTQSGTYIHKYNNADGCPSADTLHLTIHNGTHNATTVTKCESYTWTAGTGLTYTQSGTYIHQYNNADGCPSADTLHLIVNKPQHQSVTVTAYDSYTWHGETHTLSGEYLYAHEDENNCEQVDTLHLTVYHSSAGEFSDVACEQYQWNDSVYTVSGDYTQTFLDVNGADSVVTLHLTINNGTHNATTITECESYTWTAGTELTYTQSGTYIHHYNNAEGCPSADTLHLTIHNGTHNVTTVTECESYTWTAGTGLTYTQSGTYIHQYNNAEGCPSADTLHLTIHNGTHNATTVTECESYTWTAGTGQTYTQSGTYIHHYNNGDACPSADTLHLTIHNGTHNATSVTECESYTWTAGTGQTYTESGTYIHHYNNSSDCPSADTLHLIILNGTHNVTTVTECESYTWTDGTGQTYTESGTYIHHYNNGDACPSADTLHLTIHNGTHNVTSVTECESYTWTEGTGQTYTESGTYIHHYNNGDACPSADTLHLTIHNGTHNVINVTECESYTWTAGTGQTYTESGTYIHHYNNGDACPSADTLKLTIRQDTHSAIYVTECESYTWTTGTGLTYTQSGTYIHNYNNNEGCSGTDTLHLTIHNGTHNATSVTECESYTWTEGTGLTYTESGTYIHHYNNGDGCPSADTLHLTINYGTHNVTTVTECESYTWTAGTGLTYTESGTYIHSYNNGFGCPSSDTLHLTIHNGTHNVTTVTECESYTWTAGTGQTYTESGTYINHYNNGDACPSTDTLHLTIHNGTHNVTTVTECESYTWTAGTGQTYTESGTYIHHYNNSSDCPSADTLHLIILNGTHNVTTVTECESYTWTEGTGQTYTESGTYINHYNNGDGCPSADTLHLTIHNGTHNVTTITECESYTWTAGTGQTYTESGTYIHHYNNSSGCPSTDTLHLTINYGTHNVTTVTECESYTWTAGTGLTYTESGTYFHNYNNNEGCSGTDTLHLTILNGTHNVTSVTECESYTWTAGTGQTYTESGTYIHHYNNGDACPSADTLHLTIHNGTHNVTSVTECESYTWTAGTGQTYTESGTYIHHYNNSSDCPSADTLHLTINYGTHNVTTVTECESYTWTAGTGQTYTESGTYIHYYNNGDGCPSADTLHLAILNGTHNVTTVTECESYTWTAGTGLTYTESGTYFHNYNNNEGCSGTDTLHLTILNGTHNVTSVTECESYTWTEGTGLTYTESGTYIHHYNNGDACPSTDTLHLTIHNGTHNVTSVTECETYTWTAGTGQTYTESGTYINHYNNGDGCPSADTLHLTINYGTHNVTTVTECESYTWTAGTGQTYTESGTYIHYYNNSDECPSTDTLHLTINYGTHNVTTVTECESYTWTAGTGQTYTESGTYIYHYNNSSDCPSADTLHLTIHNGTHNVTSVTECESYTWTAGTGLTYTESGTYIHHYNNSSDCPSADTLHLIILNGTHNVTTVTECESYSWTEGTGQTYTESGTYIHHYNNGDACPSADTLHLTIHNGTYNVTSVTECESYTWTAGTGQTYTESGTYIHHYNNSSDCPSTDTLHLIILNGTHNVTTVTECESYTWTAGTGQTYTESGTYIHHYNNGDACPSADTLHLTINYGTHNVTTVTECESYSWTEGTGQTYTESGTYIHHYNNGNACPSADTLHLTIHNGTHNVTTVTECESYTWTAGTGQTYTESGTYIHYYNNGDGCPSADTLYLTITTVGINEYNSLSGLHIIVYPNPAHDVVNIKVDDEFTHLTNADIYDATGRRVKTLRWAEANSTQQVNMEEFAPGLYFIRLFNDKQSLEIHKIIKQ